MTVSELIDELKKLDPKAPVYAANDDDSGLYEVGGVRRDERGDVIIHARDNRAR